ncbi:MAG: hypothetical protein WC823_00280 [Parcubacteria group bacterium]|jgi:hypothetical protein
MEKAIETMLAVSVVLSTIGGTLVTTGKIWEGLACIMVGTGLIFLRGMIK